MTSQFNGSCLCGEVSFVVEGEFDRFYLCHCEYCRKDTGSAHAANLFSTGATLQWISGESSIKYFVLPGTRHTKNFCSICSSALPISLADGKLVRVPAGCIDGDLALRPTLHLFTASKADWDDRLEQIASVEKLPA
ncbi:GFA family protein [Neptunicella sp. SCSIO 80796]|uniref:GFA family protein n=1 Tax=Neptunicella plasticusilytica TaxID=3117012 RepID=UPI003A4DCC05